MNLTTRGVELVLGVTILITIGVSSIFFQRILDLTVVASIIWLAFLGQWWALMWIGIILLIGAKVFSFIALPIGFLIAGLFYLFKPKSKLMMLVLTFVSHTSSLILMVLMNLGILYIFISNAVDYTWIPLVFVSYGLAAGIWGFFLYEEIKDGTKTFAEELTLFAEFSFLIVSIIAVATRAPFPRLVNIYKKLVIIYLPVMAIRLYRYLKEADVDLEMTFDP